MPAGPGAPDTIDNPVLTTNYIGQIEGKQTLEQKEYTINWQRDNIRRLNKFAGKTCTFMEIDGNEFTGRKFNGTLSFDKDAFSDNEAMEGKVWITVTDDLGFVDDVRDLFKVRQETTDFLYEKIREEVHNKFISLSDLSKPEIFQRMVTWLQEETRGSYDACEIVISYFIQSCEVFYAATE